MNTITTEEAVRLIYQSGGRAFAATFTKKNQRFPPDDAVQARRPQAPFPAHSHGHPTQEPPPMWRFVYAYPNVPSVAACGSPNNCYCT